MNTYRTNDLRRLRKGLGQDVRERWNQVTQSNLDKIEGKDPGVFHETGASKLLPSYIGKFGPDESTVMHIVPSPSEWRDHVRYDKPPPRSWHIEYAGSLAGSPHSIMHPHIQKEIDSALQKLGVGHVTFDPANSKELDPTSKRSLEQMRARIFGSMARAYNSGQDWRDLMDIFHEYNRE